MNKLPVRRVLASVLLLVAGGCAGNAPTRSSAPIPLAANDLLTPKTPYPIKHVVIVVQENRSFDNFFTGYPGAASAESGPSRHHGVVAMKPTTFAHVTMPHIWQTAMTEWDDGKQDGFDSVHPTNAQGARPPATFPYSYVERSEIGPYWAMARQYALADHMFSTEFGPSFTAHQMLIAGTTRVSASESLVNLPTANGNCDAAAGTVTSLVDTKRVVHFSAGPFPCLDTYDTIADTLDAAHVSWKYYNSYLADTGSLWNAFEAIKKVRYGPDWANVVTGPRLFLKAAKSGELPGVSWVIPDFANSDHPSAGSDTGPSWVASVVNSIGKGPDWNSTLIIVVWDDWGGWYDNVKPPQLDYRGLGFRVPALVISPYTTKGVVSHTQYEFGSVLKTVEQIFNLPSLGYTDRRANSMLDTQDFTQAPRPFKPVKAKYSTDFFMHQAPSNKPVDDD